MDNYPLKTDLSMIFPFYLFRLLSNKYEISLLNSLSVFNLSVFPFIFFIYISKTFLLFVKNELSLFFELLDHLDTHIT